MYSPFWGGKLPGTLRILRWLYHLPNFAKLTWRLFWDPRVPIYRKAILVVFELIAIAFAVAYFVYPLDFDFLPIVGKIDDLLIGIFLILFPGAWLFIKLSPESIVLEHVERISKGY